MSRRAATALVAAFLALGAALRLYHFWVPELWNDEYGTWWAVTGDWGETARRVVRFAGQSPLYYFLVKLVADGLGPGPFALRLLSLVCGVLTVTLAYPLGLRVFRDRYAAVLAVATFAVNDRLISYSQDARPYSLALVLTMLATVVYLRLLDGNGGPAARAAYLATVLALFYVHYLFAVVVLVHVAYLGLRRRLTWLRERAWVAPYLALAVLALPGLAHLAMISSRRQVMSWFGQGAEAPFTLAVQMVDPLVFTAVGLAVLAVGFDPSSRGVADTAARRDFVLLWFLLPIGILGLAGWALGVALLYSRYALAMAPAGLLMLAWLMAAGRRTPRLRWVPLATGLVAATIWYLVPALASVGVFASRPVEAWGRVARAIDESGRAGDAILVQSGFVEGDLLARGPVDPSLVSGLTWPLVANLRARDQYQVIALPYRASAETLPYVEAVSASVRDRPRVWVVGSSEAVTQAARVLVNDGRRRVVGRAAFDGTIVLLVATGPE